MNRTLCKRILRTFLIVLCIMTGLKILFAGYDIDEQYAVSMAYRMLKGDLLLTDMWEPHQTSGFLCALLMQPYLALFSTTTGVFLYLRLCGLLLHGLTAFFLYRTLRRRFSPEYAFLLGCIAFFTLPKLMFLPEFSNMQTDFLLWAVLCLLRYYDPVLSRGERPSLGYLYAAGSFMALEVLAYPSTILAFLAAFVCMLRYRGRRGHSAAAQLLGLILPCVLGAAAFLAVLLSHIPLSEMGSLIAIVSSDGSHSAPLNQRLLQHAQSLGQLFLFFLLYALADAGILLICRCRSKKPFSAAVWCFLLLSCTLLGQVCIWLFAGQYPNYPMAEYFFLPVLLLVALLRHKVRSSPTLGFFVLTPLAAFLGILLFSNHPLLVSLPFLTPCVVGILSLPELQAYQQRPAETDAAESSKKSTGRLRLMPQALLVLWVCVLLFGRCYMLRTTGGAHYTVFEELSLMRQGPAAGLIADTPSVIRYRDNYRLVAESLPDGAKVFYMGTNTDLYLMKDLEFCTPSTICSPTFDDKILLYFEQHPEKEPEYVVCDAGLLYTDPWVSAYIRENCPETPLAVNDYLRIYRCN